MKKTIFWLGVLALITVASVMLSNVSPAFAQGMPSNGSSTVTSAYAMLDAGNLNAQFVDAGVLQADVARVGALDAGTLFVNGTSIFATTPMVVAGTSSGLGRAHGTLDSYVTFQQNSGAGVTAIRTLSIAANTISAQGRYIRLTVLGQTAANGNTKTITVTYGGDDICGSASTTANNKSFVYTCHIHYGSDGTYHVVGFGHLAVDGASNIVTVGASTNTGTAAQNLVTNFQGTSTGDLTLNMITTEAIN